MERRRQCRVSMNDTLLKSETAGGKNKNQNQNKTHKRDIEMYLSKSDYA